MSGRPKRATSLASDYRGRVYDFNVHAAPLAPETLAGLNDRAPYINKVIRLHFPADRAAAIVDLGCGHGPLIHFARRAGYRNVWGVDRSREQVAEARRLGIEGVQHGDLMETLSALPDASQDVVVTFDVIEHFTRDELLPLIDEVRRVLRAGGRWIIHTPNAESPFFGRIRYGDITHEQAFTTTSIGQLLMASGFANLRCYDDAPVIHGVKSAARYAAWRAIRGLLRLYLVTETGSAGSGVLTQNFLVVAST